MKRVLHTHVMSIFDFRAAMATIFMLLFLIPKNTEAQLEVYDGFNYTTGTNALNSQTGGTGNWCGSGAGWFAGSTGLDISSGSLGYSASSLSLNTVGNYVSGITGDKNDFRRMTTYYGSNCTGAGNPLWIVFTARRNSGNSSTAGYCGISLFDSQTGSCNGNNTGGAEILFMGKRSGAANWGFQFNAGAGNSTGVAFDNTTRILVYKISFTAGSQWHVRMWVDPPLNAIPQDGVQGSAAGYCEYLNFGSTACIDKFRIQAGGGSTWDVDELRMGKSFADVIPVVAPTAPTINITTGANPTCSGSSVTFTATAGSNSGTSPTYQWKKNGTNISGATNSTYTGVAGTDFINTDIITCQLTQGVGSSGLTAQSATSTGITMTVNTAVSIGTQPTDQTVCTANNATFTVAATGTGLTYQWRKNGVNISNGATGNGSTYSGATTASLTITGAVAGDAALAAAGYDCVVSGTAPCSALTSNRVALNVTASIIINTQPTAQTACSTPGTASFTITATAASPTYQWRLNGVNLSNGAQGNGSTVSGATTATLSLSGLTSSHTVVAGSGYECVVSSSCGSPVTSSRVALTVSTAPSITVQPTAQTACSSPGTATYSVTATGDGLTYQWRLNSVNLSNGAQGNGSSVSGATTATLSLFSLTASHTVVSGSGYDCVVSGTAPCSAATSTRVALTVNTAPAVTVNPTDQTVCSGSSASFTVTATNAASYQWQKNGVNINNGATGNGSTYSGATTATLTITGAVSADAAISANGYSCVVSGTAPCGTTSSTKAALTVNSAAAISVQPTATAVCSGATANFSVTASGSPSFAWRKRGSGWGAGNAWAVTSGGSGATTYGTFIGSSSDINTSNKTWALYSNSSTSEAIRSFSPLSVGHIFRVDIDNQLIATGGTVGFGLRNASGQNMVEFYFVGGATNYQINRSGGQDNAIAYTTNGIRFTLTVTSATTYSITLTKPSDNTSLGGPYTGTFINTGSIAQFRAFDANGNATLGSTYDFFFNSIKAGPSVANPIFEDDATSYSNLNTGDNLGNGALSNGATGTGSTVSGATTASLSIATTGSSDLASYDVVVYNSCGGTTSSAAALTFNAATAIGTQPTAQTACAGTSASFTVAASGTGTLTYQWRKNGANISGATSTTYTISSTVAGDAALAAAGYDVVVTGDCGSATSNRVALTVNPATTIGTQPTAQAACVGATATFTVAATGTGSLTYQWRKNGSNISGATSTTYTISSTVAGDAALAGAGYDVVVTSPTCGSVTSNRVALTVNAATLIGTQPTAQTACEGSSATFTVAATGTGTLTYQWRKNGSNISGATSASYTITTTDAGDAALAAAGYDVVVTSPTCGSVTSNRVALTVNPLPTTFNVTGGGTLCSGDAGFSVGLDGSETGVNYQLKINGSNTGSPIAGDGNAIDFGVKTAAGTYTVVATNATTACGATMTGSAVVTVNPLPTAYGLTGGGAYCFGGSAPSVGLANSQSGVNYQLKLDGSDLGSPVAGTGSSISFGTQATEGTYTVVATNATTTCTNTMTGSVSVTVNPLPTVFTVTGGGGYCVGGSGVAVGLSGSQNGVNYQLKLNGSNTGSPLAGTGSAISFGLKTVGTYTVVATNATTSCTSNMTGSVTAATYSGYTWTGAVNNDYNNDGNWLCSAHPVTPLASTTITVEANKTMALPGDASVGSNITLSPGSTIDLNGHTLTLTSAVAGTGTFTGSSTSNLIVNANVGSINFTSGGQVLHNLTVNNGGTVTLNTPVNITAGATPGTVTVNAGGTLNTGGNLILKSDTLGTSSVGISAGTINGNVTIERYIPKNSYRGWRMLSVPVDANSQTIRQSWQEGATSYASDPNPGYGTRITTSNAGAVSLGYDAQTFGNSLLTWNPYGNGWPGFVGNLTTTSVSRHAAGDGWLLYIRGNRSVDTSFQASTTPSSTVLRVKGDLYKAPYPTITAPYTRRQVLVGNIVPSEIDFRLLNMNNLDSAFTVWDPKLYGDHGLGQFVTFKSGLTDWHPSVAGGSFDDVPNTKIPSGAAFFVTAKGGGQDGSIQIVEGAKTSGTNTYALGFRPAAPRPAAATPLIAVRLFAATSATTENLADGVKVGFNDIYSNDIDGDDNTKIPGFGDGIAILRGTTLLNIEARKAIVDGDIVPFRLTFLKKQNYRLEINPSSFNILDGTSAVLEDNYVTSNTQSIPLDQITSLTFSADPAIAASFTDRFRIVFTKVAPVNVLNVSAQQKNTAMEINWKVAVENGVKQYEVERSTDGSNFTKVGTVAAVVNNGGAGNYSWLDAAPKTGISYYRIKTVDFSGVTSYTYIIKVAFGAVNTSIVLTNTMINNGQVGIQLNNQDKGKYSVRVINTLGQELVKTSFEHQGGNSTQTVKIPTNSKGIYQLELVKPNGNKQIEKIVVN